MKLKKICHFSYRAREIASFLQSDCGVLFLRQTVRLVSLKQFVFRLGDAQILFSLTL